jgi:hypothetical protein
MRTLSPFTYLFQYPDLFQQCTCCWRSRSDQTCYFNPPAKRATHQGQASSLGSLIIATKALPFAKRFHLGFLCYLIVKMGLISEQDFETAATETLDNEQQEQSHEC